MGILIALRDYPPPSLLLLTSGPHLMAQPRVDLWWRLTRSCPGRKQLFRQPYLLWGVKGDPWIMLRGQALSKHWLLSDDTSSSGVRFCLQELRFSVPTPRMTVKQRWGDVMITELNSEVKCLVISQYHLKIFKYANRTEVKIQTQKTTKKKALTFKNILIFLN